MRVSSSVLSNFFRLKELLGRVLKRAASPMHTAGFHMKCEEHAENDPLWTTEHLFLWVIILTVNI